MRRFKILSAAVLIILTATTLFAQDKSPIKIDVPPLDVSKLGWGMHTIPIKITNDSEYTKFVTVVTNVKCQGTHLSPERNITHFNVVYSESTVEFAAKMLVPGNYGNINIEIKFYSVIDTMDFLMESQVIHKQSGSFKVSVPKEIAAIIAKGITLPPLVGKHFDFDNDFSRVLPFLIDEGNSVSQIAEKTGTTVKFVNEEIDYLASRGYYKRDGDIILLGIAPITEKEATEEKLLAIVAAEQIATKLAENSKTYRNVIDSLVKVGTLTPDSNSFLDGGTVLYHPYPVIAALSMWYDLGRSFVTGDALFTLFDGSDLCNAYIPSFMYVVEGNIGNNGHQHYAFMRNPASYQINYGDTIPRLSCPDNAAFSDTVSKSLIWEYEQPYFPETFMIDSSIIRPMLNHLRQGIDPILEETFDKLAAVANKHGQPSLAYGHRYWFWNIVATRTNELLVARGVLKPRGNGQFRFDGINFR